MNGNSVARKKSDTRFLRMMLLMSLLMHFVLCLFFYRLGIKALVYYNVVSVFLYLFFICAISRVRYVRYWMTVAFVEVIAHVVLCNLYLGWGYGFSLYGLMIIPVTYFISYMYADTDANIIWVANVLSFLAVIVVIISCVKSDVFDKCSGLSIKAMLYIFCINMALGVLAIVMSSAYFVKRMNAVTSEIAERNEELEFYAHYDVLTNMRNRQNMEEIFMECERNGGKYCVVLGDLDDFKLKNDRYGHVNGDELLVHISSIIRQAVRNRGEVFRWGGDEILMLLKMDQMQGCQLAEDIRQQIQKFSLKPQGREDMWVTITFGFAYCDEAEGMERLISIADRRLYEGKSKGKNQIVKG